MRRIAIIVTIVSLAAGVIWFGVWSLIAGRVEGAVANGLADAAGQGLALSCEGQEIGGFPLRIDVICGKIDATDTASGIQAAMAGLRTATPLYRPWHSTADLASPLRLSGGPLPAPVEVTWSAAEISLEGGVPVPDRMTFSARDLQAAFGEIAIRAASTKAEAQQTPDRQGATLSLSAFASQLTWLGRQTNVADITVKARIDTPPEALMRDDFDPRRTGLSIPELTIRLQTAGALVELSGALSFDASGQVSGKLKVHVVGADALPAFIGTLPPAAQPPANAVVGGVFVLGTPVTFEGHEAKMLVLAIDGGVVRMGPLTLGRIPPLF